MKGNTCRVDCPRTSTQSTSRRLMSRSKEGCMLAVLMLVK
jgi:hypothetical protein